MSLKNQIQDLWAEHERLCHEGGGGSECCFRSGAAGFQNAQDTARIREYAAEEHHKLGWTLLIAALEFDLIDAEGDDCPKPKEYGGTVALAELLITELRKKKAHGS
jgi:hypothetical protein